jgi:hypothetical protein
MVVGYHCFRGSAPHIHAAHLLKSIKPSSKLNLYWLSYSTSNNIAAPDFDGLFGKTYRMLLQVYHINFYTVM